jgi:outer membrane protein TolC
VQGKRGYRVQRDQRFSEAARFELAETAWKVRARVRSALLAYLLAVRNLDLLRSEEQVREEQVKLLNERVAEGEIPRPDADSARIELSKTRLSIGSAEGLSLDLTMGMARLLGAGCTIVAQMPPNRTILPNVRCTFPNVSRWFRTPGVWNRVIAKPLYGLTPVPRVRIPPSPPLHLFSAGYMLVIPHMIPS